MKTREQNRNNKRTTIGQFDWFIERIQTRVAFGWLSEQLGEKNVIERFSYNLEMKTREQNRNNKPKKIGRFDWFVERIQTRVAFDWLSEQSGEKTACPRTF